VTRGLGACLVAAILVLQVRADAVYLRLVENPRAFRAWCSPAISELSARVRALEPDLVLSADWGLHTQLFSLARTEERSRFVDLWVGFEDAAVLEPERETQLHDRYFEGRRVLVVMHTPDETAMPAARRNFLSFRAAMLGDTRAPEIVSDANGRPLYELYVTWRP
jgi:hypothetical protein